MNWKTNFESHPVVYGLGLIAIGVLFGFPAGRQYDNTVSSLHNYTKIEEGELGKLKTSIDSANEKVRKLNEEIDICKNSQPTKSLIIADNRISISKEIHNELQNRPISCPNTIQEIVYSDTSKDAFKKECLDNETPNSIVSNFEEYANYKNEKIFTDHYAGKWSCNYTWIVSLNSRPEQKNNMYWEFYASSLNKNEKQTLVWVTLKEGTKVPSWLNKGAKIKVIGKIVKAARHGLTLVEAEYQRVKID